MSFPHDPKFIPAYMMADCKDRTYCTRCAFPENNQFTCVGNHCLETFPSELYDTTKPLLNCRFCGDRWMGIVECIGLLQINRFPVPLNVTSTEDVDIDLDLSRIDSIVGSDAEDRRRQVALGQFTLPSHLMSSSSSSSSSSSRYDTSTSSAVADKYKLSGDSKAGSQLFVAKCYNFDRTNDSFVHRMYLRNREASYPRSFQ